MYKIHDVLGVWHEEKSDVEEDLFSITRSYWELLNLQVHVLVE